jgi:secreted PhoX family phosphatase
MLYASGVAVALVGGYPLLRAFSRAPRSTWRPGPYGPMRPDPAGILDLPEGFSYRIVQRAGEVMSDGLRVPGRPDGMACFEFQDPELGGRALVLMRNHENPAHVAALGPWTGAPAPEAWTSEGMGGVTRVVLDPGTLAPRSSNLVLGGTLLNCAGGPSPWGWLSCEETFGARHGYVFACDPRASSIERPRPIRAYGKFCHEAACVDPEHAIAYLSEDREESCLYRFVPASPDHPFGEGELSALAIRGRPRLDTARGLRVGDRLEVAWVPLREPEPEQDVLRHVAQRQGAARFCRGEGLAWEVGGPRGGSVILTATAGGPHATGQIFRLEPDGDGGELVLLAQSEGTEDFDMPDNVVVAPGTGWIFFCEDGHGRNHVRVLEPGGTIFDFARNALSDSEITGVCFSPDGRAMFLNLQRDGLTLAVTGPFVA